MVASDRIAQVTSAFFVAVCFAACARGVSTGSPAEGGRDLESMEPADTVTPPHDAGRARDASDASSRNDASSPNDAGITNAADAGAVRETEAPSDAGGPTTLRPLRVAVEAGEKVESFGVVVAHDESIYVGYVTSTERATTLAIARGARGDWATSIVDTTTSDLFDATLLLLDGAPTVVYTRNSAPSGMTIADRPDGWSDAAGWRRRRFTSMETHRALASATRDGRIFLVGPDRDGVEGDSVVSLLDPATMTTRGSGTRFRGEVRALATTIEDTPIVLLATEEGSVVRNVATGYAAAFEENGEALNYGIGADAVGTLYVPYRSTGGAELRCLHVRGATFDSEMILELEDGTTIDAVVAGHPAGASARMALIVRDAEDWGPGALRLATYETGLWTLDDLRAIADPGSARIAISPSGVTHVAYVTTVDDRPTLRVQSVSP